MHKISNQNKLFFFAILGIVLFFAFLVAQQILNVIILAFLTVLLFNPVYTRIYNRTNKNVGLASGLTTLIVFITVIVPLIIIGIISVSQISAFINDLSEFIKLSNPNSNLGSLRVEDIINTINLQLNQLIPNSGLSVTVSQLQDIASKVGLPIGQFILDKAFAFVRNIPVFMTELIIYVILVTSLFPAQKNLRKYLMQITPWENKLDALYFNKIKAMALSMIKGTFVIAIIQGVIAGILLTIAGVEYVFFWTLLSIFLGIIPIGSGFINFPIGVILLLTGNVPGGLLVLLGNIFIVNTIDNLLRPRLVSNEAALHPALILVGVIGGLQAFGFFGFIYGPVIMILLVTSLDLYRDLYRES